MSEPNAQAPADTPHGRSSLGRRRLAATVTVIVCLALAVGAGMALQHIRSPKAQALAQAAPAKSVVTAQVSRQVVESTIAGTGTVQVSASETVPVPEASAARTVLSKLPVKVGHAVKNGTVLAEVSGRPVIVLKGAIAAYRD
ncbi:MAG: hypothetical protein LBM66_01145, partial [Bifidobacteriaceae bacterium]|nr:hypothetical protein [Bifidobacteriaceae bacterium]